MPAWSGATFGTASFGGMFRPPAVAPPPPAGATFREGLVALLAADPGVAAAVADRVFPLTLPAGAVLPALTYQVLTDPRDYDLDGASGTAGASVEFTALSRSLADCAAITDALWNLFGNYSGTLPGGVVVDEAHLEEETDFDETPGDDSDAWTYRVVQVYSFMYKVNIPLLVV